MDIALDPPPDLTRRDPIAAELAELGMSAAIAAIFREAVSRPDGLVVIAGRAGSGRTTTLRAGRRLRGDKGVVLADEIDDAPAVDHAIQSALEGRLVIATIRADGAVDAITRLKRMRTDPFLIAVALRAVLGQRLVRRLCPSCRRPVQASRDVSARLGDEPGTVIYEPAGCAACGGTGYQGRVGLFEAIQVDPPMRRLLERGDAPIIAGHAFRGGPDLGGAARAMVKAGGISAGDALLLSRPSNQFQ